MEPEFSVPRGYTLLTDKELKDLLESAEKLEAVRNQIDEFPCVHIQDYQRMMRKIKKILEAETE